MGQILVHLYKTHQQIGDYVRYSSDKSLENATTDRFAPERKRRIREGFRKEQEVETGGRRLPLARGPFRVDQQATLDKSQSGVAAVNVDRS